MATGGRDQVQGAPRLVDVARLAGVSEATASRALTDSRPVAPELRERVLAAATQLDYAPNLHAQALARAGDASIGVVVHDVTDPYFSEIVRGVVEAAEAGGRMVLIADTLRRPDRELAYIQHFRAQRVHAILLAGSGRIDRQSGAQITAEVLRFERAGGRAVLLGRHHATGDTVRPDNSEGARSMARYLLGLGHRRIGVVTGPSNLTTNEDRLDGFRRQLADSGVDLPKTRVRSGGFSRAGGEAATAELVESQPDLTAVFALNDVMAVGVVAALRRLGRRVPDDVSVAGFDDIPFAADLEPALTTVRVPMAEVGRRAFDLAMAPRSSGYAVERIPTTLVERASTSEAR